jgi:DNA-binding response OmpR family regulator
LYNDEKGLWEVRMRLLIVEDDKDLNEGLAFAFSQEGYEIETAFCYSMGLDVYKHKDVDAIILDCNLPDGNGFDFCRAVRRESLIPIVMLTARDTEIDELKGLEVGADDYISKPFSIAVLKMRIKNAIRKKESPKVLNSQGIKIDISKRKAYKNNAEVDLSPIEWQLLYYLMENSGRVLLKQEILNFIWDINGNFVDENAISVNIRRLRLKIEDDPSNPKLVKAVRGFGYRWCE